MKKLACLVLILSCFAAKAQIAPHNLKGIVSAVDSFKNRLPIEKLYLQTDKPYYTLGDTLWFKSYLLNADYLTPSTKSGLLYLELDEPAGRIIKRIMVPVSSGISWGDIALNAEEVREGNYILRAYTNWMRNFGEDYIFKKNIYISALSGSTLVKANFKLDSLAGKNKVTANLTFANLDKNPIRLKNMRLNVMNGRHNLFRDKATTGMDGSLHVNFDLADKTQLNNLSIIANQTGKGVTDTATLTIPVTINRPEKTDVQFMPEGGNLVAGITTKVGFKAIGEDGKGTAVTGKIVNSKNQTITTIQTIHKGMGSFELTPEQNETYMAVINLPNKTTKSYALPKVNTAGTALRITNKGNDSLEVVLSLKPGVESPKSAPVQDIYYLIGQARGVVCYAATIKFIGQASTQTINKIVARNLFPTGIVRFTLLNQNNIPLNERIVYIDHHDNLNISLIPSKPGYNTRDSIALNIQVKDKYNNPVHGTFSLAVTDNDQVKPDSIGSNIINNLLFTSDLKGTIEEPGWYFDPDSYRDQNPTVKQSNNKTIALDNLLLTQGWIGYNWKDVFDPKLRKIEYPTEKEFIVQGKVTNIFGGAVAKSPVVLFGKLPPVFRDTITGKDGIFTFKGLYPIDTAEFKIEARNKNGKAFNVGINMLNEFRSPTFTSIGTVLPWYVNSDTSIINNSSIRADQLKAEADYRGEGNLLKEVKINSKKIIPDSHNLNGSGEADFTLEEKDTHGLKELTLFEFLKKKFKEVYTMHEMMRVKNPHGESTNELYTRYVVLGHTAHLIIDGVWASNEMMDVLTAGDIKGVEIMRTSKYALAYDPDFIHDQFAPYPILIPIFLEITTYSGHGAYLKHTPGTYSYEPLPYTLAKQFYRPRYTVKNKNIAPGTDLRSTIYWEPNVITDKDGKATISFFSADKPADYTVMMEGTDLNGNLGYQRKKIKVVSTPITTK